MSQAATRPAPATRLRGLSSGFVLVVGVLLVPMALAIIFNSYEAPDHAAYVRMAFAQVAGATIAISTVVGLVVQRAIRRSRGGEIAWFALIALVIIAWQATQLSSAAELLLARLSSSN